MNSIHHSTCTECSVVQPSEPLIWGDLNILSTTDSNYLVSRHLLGANSNVYQPMVG